MRNRTILGIVCIFLSLLITFGFSPLINRLLGGDMTVIRLSRDVRQGEEITADCTESVKVKKSTVPSGIIITAKELKGKYALSDLYAGDYLKKEKLSGTGNSVKEAFASLDGDKSAVTKIPPELKYLKVITTTTGDGTDADKAKANENGVKPTAAAVTVLCNSVQARLIAEYENNGNIQVSLAYRGKAENANVFLEAQEKYFGGK